MDADRLRIQDDLRGVIRGDVLCDPLTTQMYASDASIYQVEPVGVIRPRSAADVVAVAQYAAEHELSLHPRGSGSSVSGASLGRGLVIDFSRYMRRVSVSPDGNHAIVQSGVVLADLNKTLKRQGRWYGPDPATRSVTTMGGVIATNASGSHFLRSGAARDTVESVRAVTIDGDLIELGVTAPDRSSTTGKLAAGLLEIRNQFSGLVDTQSGGSPARGGYRLDDIAPQADKVNLGRFFAGTQGTLAMMIDATVRTELIPTYRGVVLLFFRRLETAVRCVSQAMEHGPVACDIMDRRLLQIARGAESWFAEIAPSTAEAVMLVELQSESEADLKDRISVVRRGLVQETVGAFNSVETTDPLQRDQFWSLCRRVVPRQYRVQGKQNPLPFIEDLSVPVDNLPSAISAVQETLKQYQCTATIFCHAGHGQLHVRPMLDLSDPADRSRLLGISESLAQVAWDQGGEVCVEQAAGLSRSYLLPKQYGELWQAMGQVKRLFDPLHRLNPGKYFGAILQKPNENLRPAHQTIEVRTDTRTLSEANEAVAKAAFSAGNAVPQLEVLQQWPPNATVSQVARACNGCARCRTNSSGERQCPVFRATHREEASPRAKANLLRGVLSGDVPVAELTSDASKEIADLCFNCHQCRVDCPASVNVPKIVGELKAQYVATNGLPLSDLFLGRIDSIVAAGSVFPRLTNLFVGNSLARWTLEKTFGIAAARQLPAVATESFIKHAARRRWTKMVPHGGLKVLYFVDHYANYHDPDIGRAFAEILQQNRIGLYVPAGQQSSGMTRLSAGDLKGARRIARRNIRILSDAVRQGYTIVASEPAAALCLTHEYPNLLDNEDAHLVAAHSKEANAYLWDLHQHDRLDLHFSRVDATFAYHQPCHSRAMDRSTPVADLLSLIPGMEVEPIEAGCTGMAGTWGLHRKNYRNSLRIGWPLISAMRNSNSVGATTECSACQMQIEHGTGRQMLHPLKVLAYAYGRMPKLEGLCGTKTENPSVVAQPGAASIPDGDSRPGGYTSNHKDQQP